MSGSLHLIIGPMFCGKTTELIRLKNRATIAGKRCLVIKYCNDSRYDEKNLSTHDKIKSEAILSEGNLLSATTKKIPLEDYDNIYIDEIQFYSDGANVCDELANRGFDVVVCGLQGDFNRKPFGTIPELIAYADKITHLTAIDSLSGNEAPFTKRISDEKDKEVIGGSEKYRAVDRKNYFNF